jgi:ATP-dependent helicase HepA
MPLGASLRKYRRPAKGGWIARAFNDSRGLGKVVEEEADRVTIEYFISAWRQERVVHERSHVIHVHLTKQTRCYVFSEDDQRWHMGRIGEHDGAEYEINLPDRTSIYVSEAEVYVRCALLPEDPTETLRILGHETAIFYDARLRLTKELVKQRAAARGMTGLTSSRIEFFPHQVEVARRVLQDSVQRYLLADEVGLGKTIEAGIIIRQLLLDDSEAKVVIVVPSLLLEQWKGELSQKFDVLHRVLVISVSDLQRIPEDDNLDLLIFDEAHHIANWASSKNAIECARWEACKSMARRADRLLLLSATPAANHETQFLAMLHLLDPQTYHLEDLKQFRDRIEKRRDIGGVLLTLTETARPYSLRLTIGRLEKLFPDDRLLQNSLRQLDHLLTEAPDNLQDRSILIRSIRAHVSETYRLHRRMLRNRRNALNDAVLARSSFRVEIHRDDSNPTAAANDALEEWRVLAAAAARNADSSDRVHLGLKNIFLTFVEAADGSPWLLELAASYRLGEECTASEIETLRSELSTESFDALGEVPHFLNEDQCLAQLLTETSAPELEKRRFDEIVKLLRQIRSRAGISPPPKCIVFTSSPWTARLLGSYLEKHLRTSAIACHVAGISNEISEESVQRFRTSRECFVLVTDRTGEEGRNFQFAEHLIHYDLPWHPNRLEQRVGRLDRISRRRDLVMHVFISSARDGGLGTAWFEMLSNGLAVFSESVASLQFYVDARLPWILDTAFFDGGPGLSAATSLIRSEIRGEKEKVEEQAAIDEIDSHESGAEEYFRKLDDSDADFDSFQSTIDDWFCKILGFTKEHDAKVAGRFRYRANRNVLVADDVIRGRFGKKLEAFGAADRRIASAHPDTRIYRLGDELVDALADYVAWDDRGQSFAIWRQDATWDSTIGSEWAGFRFDMTIEANTDEAWAVLADHGAVVTSRRALVRRGDAFLPPRTATIFVDIGLAEVRDSSLLKILRRRFSKHRTANGQDYNLTKHKLKVLDSIVSSDEWEGLCRRARDAALQLLRQRSKFRECNDVHAEGATAAIRLKGEQLRLRVARAGVADASDALEEAALEEEVGEALVRGIKEPRVHIDAAGFIVISGRSPSVEFDDSKVGNAHA